MMKVCGRCGYSKGLSEFYAGKRYKDGLQPWCRSCYRVYKIESGYSKNLARSYASKHTDEFYREAYANPRSKRCPECKESKGIAAFYREVHSADGFASYCKACDTRKNRSIQDQEKIRINARRVRAPFFGSERKVRHMR